MPFLSAIAAAGGEPPEAAKNTGILNMFLNII
jgi:hypothetical protein